MFIFVERIQKPDIQEDGNEQRMSSDLFSFLGGAYFQTHDDGHFSGMVKIFSASIFICFTTRSFDQCFKKQRVFCVFSVLFFRINLIKENVGYMYKFVVS
jgi:hypothetical protein